eukprot:COSAG02_NODE_62336_length_266_cov_0.616766_1_plen_59_part_01
MIERVHDPLLDYMHGAPAAPRSSRRPRRPVAAAADGNFPPSGHGMSPAAGCVALLLYVL